MFSQTFFQWLITIGIVLTAIGGIGSHKTGKSEAETKEQHIKDEMYSNFADVINEVQKIPQKQAQAQRLMEIQKELSEKREKLRTNRQRRATGQKLN